MSRDLAADAEDAKTQGNTVLAAKDFDNAVKWYYSQAPCVGVVESSRPALEYCRPLMGHTLAL